MNLITVAQQKYILARGETMWDLEQSVNKMLRNGWKCVGGVNVTTGIPGNLSAGAYQAMIHEDWEKE